jgi:hypothetical protein
MRNEMKSSKSFGCCDDHDMFQVIGVIDIQDVTTCLDPAYLVRKTVVGRLQ